MVGEQEDGAKRAKGDGGIPARGFSIEQRPSFEMNPPRPRRFACVHVTARNMPNVSMMMVMILIIVILLLMMNVIVPVRHVEVQTDLRPERNGRAGCEFAVVVVAA